MRNNTHSSLSPGTTLHSRSCSRTRLLALLLLLVVATSQMIAQQTVDAFYTYTYDSDAKVYIVALSPDFKAQLNLANGGEFTGTTADGSSVTWKTGEPLPAFNANYDDGTNGTHPLSLYNLFQNCRNMTSLDLSKYNTTNVSIMSWMFQGCTSLSSLNLSNFNTENVTSMNGMFNFCSSLSSLNLTNFNTKKVTTMEMMFNSCSSLSSLDLSHFNTENVTSMASMFWDCLSLSSLDLSNFDTRNVKTMFGMFQRCNSLSSINLSNFDTGNVTTFAWMFANCGNLRSIDLTGFNTTKVTNMDHMFRECTALTSLDLSSFRLNENVVMVDMFYNTCNNNQGEAYQGLSATEEIANTLNNSSTTNINTSKLKFSVKKVAINEANFPDANFRSFVSDNYDTNKDGYLIGDELAVTTMDVSGKGITNLKGIEHFTSLTSLNCSNNVLTAVDLSKNTKLTTFNGTGQSVPMTLSYDSDSKKVYFDIAGAEAGKLSVTGFTLTGNGMLRATSNDAVTDRKMFDQADYTSDTGLGNNKISGQFSLRTSCFRHFFGGKKLIA